MAWRGRGGAAALWLALAAPACGRLGYEPGGAPDAAVSPADGAVPDAAPPRPLCEEVPQLPGPPGIDGVIEEGLAPIAVEVGGWKGPPEGPPAGNVSAAAVGWWPGGLYLYVEVSDPERLPPPASDPTWCGDGVELYVDADGAVVAPPAYDETGTRQLVLVAPADDTTAVSRGEIFLQTALVGEWAGGFAATPRAGGYTAEAVVGAAELGLDEWPLAAGQRVGLDLAINVSNTDATTTEPNCPNGTRLGQYVLRVDPADSSACAGHPYCNAAAFCTPALGP
jgi:hypothetical protein